MERMVTFTNLKSEAASLEKMVTWASTLGLKDEEISLEKMVSLA